MGQTGAGRSAQHGSLAIWVHQQASFGPGRLLLLLIAHWVSCWGRLEGPQTTAQRLWNSPGRELGPQLCPPSLCHPGRATGFTVLRVSSNSVLCR